MKLYYPCHLGEHLPYPVQTLYQLYIPVNTPNSHQYKYRYQKSKDGEQRNPANRFVFVAEIQVNIDET
jgi:hypothetical protein